MTIHSFLPPSGAAAWSRCALWPTMNARYPQDDTLESAEGTGAHWVCSELLGGRSYPEGFITPNNVAVTGEMLDGAALYVDTFRLRYKGNVAYTKPHVEERVSVTRIHADCFGTPDLWFYIPGNMHLEVLDYKFGHGFVDEYFNPQGLLYALGAIESLNLPSIVDTDKISVSFTVVQPRCYYRGQPVRTHSYTMAEAKPHLERLYQAALDAMEPEPTSTTNPECDHCPGRHACSALQKAAYSDAEYADARQPVDITPQAAALELRMLERSLQRLEARVDGLREYTLANIKKGAPIAHYRAEAGRGRSQWKVEPSMVLAIGKALGKDLSKPGLLTPAQAQKLGIDESVITAYSQNQSGSVKLIAQNNDDARRVFGSGE